MYTNLASDWPSWSSSSFHVGPWGKCSSSLVDECHPTNHDEILEYNMKLSIRGITDYRYCHNKVESWQDKWSMGIITHFLDHLWNSLIPWSIDVVKMFLENVVCEPSIFDVWSGVESQRCSRSEAFNLIYPKLTYLLRLKFYET